VLLGVVLFSLLHCIPLYVGSSITVLGFHGLTLSIGVGVCVHGYMSRYACLYVLLLSGIGVVRSVCLWLL